MPSISRAGLVVVPLALALCAPALAATDVRLSNDTGGGYVSEYTLATGQPYSDATISECANARGRQNEPALAIDPRDTHVVVGSSNDYCGVYNQADANGVPLAVGPIWLGYYRSENSGTSFRSSLVPGYPQDTSPYGALAQVRCADSGDPVLTWDSHGRLFAGSECSDDPAGSLKTFGDEWVATFQNPGGEAGNTLDDGKAFARSVTVAKGSSAPNLLGKFNDKTSIEADRTGGSCDGNVYFAWSVYNGSGGNTMLFSRSTDHGKTFSKPMNLGPANTELQDPDISVTGNGHVYVTFGQYAGAKKNVQNAILIVKSTDCGKSFAPPSVVRTFIPYAAEDVASPEASLKPFSSRGDDPFGEDTPDNSSRDCGSLDAHCASNYTFFRRSTSPRSTADQSDANHEYVYIVYDPSKPGTLVPTNTTYGSVGSGTGSQSGVYFVRYDGATGTKTGPVPVDEQATGHQLFPDIAVDRGTLHVLWWDSRNDDAYSPARPIGNYADQSQSDGSLDVYASTSSTGGDTWAASTRLSDVTTIPNWEQFGGRTVPFAGDYLWIDAQHGRTFGVWTDWRNTVGGDDAREPADDKTGADVKQCRDTSGATIGPDTCPRAGGLDQNIYGDVTP